MLNWIYNYGSFIQFFFQIFFWVAISVCAIVATVKFAALVKIKAESEKAFAEFYGDAEECGCDHDADAAEKTIEVESK